MYFIVLLLVLFLSIKVAMLILYIYLLGDINGSYQLSDLDIGHIGLCLIV